MPRKLSPVRFHVWVFSGVVVIFWNELTTQFLMLFINACSSCIGADNTAYLLNFIGNTLWFFGIMIGSEDHRINYFYYGLLRGFLTSIVSYILIRYYQMKTGVTDFDLSVLNRRNLIMTIQSFAVTFAVMYLQSPIVYTISSSGPVLVYVIDYFMNGTLITKKQLIGIFVACVGIALTINSHLLYRWMGIVEDMHSEFQYVQSSLAVKMTVATVFFGIILTWAYAIVITKSLKKANAVHLNFHLGFVLIAYNALGLCLYPNPEELTFELEWETLLKASLPMAAGSATYILSLFVTKKSGNVTMVGFVTVIWGYVVSIFRYGETPNVLGGIGSICIGLGLGFVLLSR